ncbi:hypothetical protein ACJ41O_006448 [Fusarium nematophilum]
MHFISILYIFRAMVNFALISIACVMIVTAGRKRCPPSLVFGLAVSVFFSLVCMPIDVWLSKPQFWAFIFTLQGVHTVLAIVAFGLLVPNFGNVNCSDLLRSDDEPFLKSFPWSDPGELCELTKTTYSLLFIVFALHLALTVGRYVLRNQQLPPAAKRTGAAVRGK